MLLAFKHDPSLHNERYDEEVRSSSDKLANALIDRISKFGMVYIWLNFSCVTLV